MRICLINVLEKNIKCMNLISKPHHYSLSWGIMNCRHYIPMFCGPVYVHCFLCKEHTTHRRQFCLVSILVLVSCGGISWRHHKTSGPIDQLIKCIVSCCCPKQPSCKKSVRPQKGHSEKRFEIQGGGQEMAVMVG